ncbi:hypothetical protein KX816_14885 [Sphingosinicellaceae bacterium]|nr:hypothetical protein KX816_14885 [Sphingosinicellaceae bacterium]
MGKYVNPVVLDGALGIVTTATRMVALSGEPADYAAANAGKLAESALTTADFTIAAGDISGRKVTVAAKSGLTVTTAGTADHIALLDGSSLLYVTTCPTQGLPSGGTLSIGTWAVEISSPV